MKKNKFMSVVAGAAAAAMMSPMAIVANAVPRADNPNVLGCGVTVNCANRVETLTSMTHNGITDALIASGQYAMNRKFYATKFNTGVYDYNNAKNATSDYVNTKIFINNKPFKGSYDKYMNKPSFILGNGVSSATLAAVAATRGMVSDDLQVLYPETHTGARDSLLNPSATMLVEINTKNHYNAQIGVNVVGEGTHNYNVTQINSNNDADITAAIANLAFPNNAGASHVYYVVANNVDGASAGMFGDGPVIALKPDGSKPAGNFNNLPAVCVGGPACSAPGMGNAEKIVGKDRYETNYLVNKKIFIDSGKKVVKPKYAPSYRATAANFINEYTYPYVFANSSDTHVPDAGSMGWLDVPAFIMDDNGNNPYIDMFASQYSVKPNKVFFAGGYAAINETAANNILTKFGL